MSVTYATVNGVLVEENRGGDVTTYVSDTLGSVVKTVDEAGMVTSESTYWPYGEVRTYSGTNPSRWGFVGTHGYLVVVSANLYVRARSYRADLGRWLSLDPYWPGEPAYQYVEGSPTVLADPSGLQSRGCPTHGGEPGCRFDGYPGSERDPAYWHCKPRPRGESPPSDYVLPYPYLDTSPNPFKFGYGNWCGRGRPGEGNKRGKPVDSLDSCCMGHDENLGRKLINGKDGCAHCLLAACARKVDCSKSPTPIACEHAKDRIARGFRVLCEGERRTKFECWFI